MVKPKIICTPITYDTLKKFVSGSVLPATATNQNKEDVIIAEGRSEEGHYYELRTIQSNEWIRINTYYETGAIDESYER